MSLTLIIVGALSVLLTLVHLFGGGKACAQPMLDANFDAVAKKTMYVCWHYITAHLLLSGGVLIWAGVSPSATSLALAAAVAISFLVFTGLFLWVASTTKVERAFIAFGQWIAFLPMGAFGLWAALSG